MQKFIIHILRQLICPLCIRCGSYQIQSNFFCKECTFQFLKPQLLPAKSTTLNGIDIYTFIKWKPWHSDSISEFVYMLKSQTSQLAWGWLVHQIQEDICSILGPAESVILIPIPGTRHSYHTNYFAYEIQQLTGSLVKNVLRHKKGRLSSQKSKNSQERRSIVFDVDEEFTFEMSTVNHIVICDDIYTSGSTVAAAVNAIKSELKLRNIRGVKISAIALFRRGKSEN